MVLGDDSTAAQLVEALEGHGAIVTHIRGTSNDRSTGSSLGDVNRLERGYMRGDLADSLLAICTNVDAELLAAVRSEADATRCMLYVVGRPQLSDFCIAEWGVGESLSEGTTE